MNILAVAISSIYMTIGYTGLLPVHMKPKYYFFLFIYFFPVYYWGNMYLGQWSAFPLVLGNSIIISFGCNKHLLDLALSLSGHFILILLNQFLMIPLNAVGKTMPYLRKHHETAILLALTLCTLLSLRIIRRFYILPKLSVLSTCPKKLLRCLLAELYISIFSLATNFIYGESVSYPMEVLSFNGFLVTVFSLSFLLVFYNMHDILKKNHELSLQQAQSEVMRSYAHRMESLYEDIRSFRHDYRNILSTMQLYIDEENNEALKEYFHRTILNGIPASSDNDYYLGRLHKLDDDAVKSLLYTKLITILNREIYFELEIAEPVPVLPINSLILCRILGILLDNAMEAAADSPECSLRIAIVATDTTVLFSITNSTLPLSVPLSRLLERGYSAKKGHEGIGLSAVAELLDSIPYANLYTKYEETFFSQTLEIQKEII